MTSTEDSVRAALRGHTVDDYDATDLLQRVHETIESPRGTGLASPRPIDPRWFVRAMATAVVCALLVGVGAWSLWSRGPGGRAETTPRGVGKGVSLRPARGTGRAPTTLPPPPAGTRYVGYRTLVLTVPRSWSSGPCQIGNTGSISYPLLFSGQAAISCPMVPSNERAPRLSFRDSIVGPPQLLGKTVPGGTLGGNQLLLTRVQRHGDYFRQSLAVPAQQFYVTVSASRLAVVNRVIESGRVLPAGFAVVPYVVGVKWGAAERALSAARLEVSSDSPSPTRRPGQHRVWSQLPRAGSIVPVGTSVRLRLG